MAKGIAASDDTVPVGILDDRRAKPRTSVLRRGVAAMVSAALGLTVFTYLAPTASADGMKTVEIVSVAAGDSHSLAVMSDGSLWAWGYNGDGEVGDGTTMTRLSPTEIMDGVVAVSTTNTHNLAVRSDGSLWAWGVNTEGELGDGTYTTRLSPVKVMDGVEAASAGYGHNLAVKPDGSLWSWGSGLMGDGSSFKTQLSPKKVMDGVVAASAGNDYSLAVKSDGSLWAWGDNYIGDGTTMTRLSPVKVMDGVIAASAGNDCSLALKSDGSLWAWGYNYVGDGTSMTRLSPVKVMDGVVAATASYDHSLALKSDGSLWAWGYNGGMLGDGTTTTMQLSPVRVLDGVVIAAAGWSNSLAVKADGSLWAWGTYAGDGTTTTQSSPVKVMGGTQPPDTTNIAPWIGWSSISGHEGDSTSATLMVTSSTLKVDSTTFNVVCSDPSAVSFGTFDFSDGGMPGYTVVSVPITLLKAGSYTLTFSTTDGATYSAPLTINPPDYEVRVVSTTSRFSTEIGTPLTLKFSLWKSGEQISSPAFSFLINSSAVDSGKCPGGHCFVLDPASTVSTDADGTTTVSFVPMQYGAATLTATDLNTHASTSFTVFSTGVNVKTFSDVKPRDAGTTNDFVSGGYLYIDNFSASGPVNGKYTANMDIYNPMNQIGTACSYDSDGAIDTCVQIDRFTDKATGFYDGIKACVYLPSLIANLATSNPDWYKDPGSATLTKVAIEVPAGGHIEISTDMDDPITAFYNAVNLSAGSLLDGAGILVGSPSDKAAAQTVKDIIKYLGLDLAVEVGKKLTQFVGTDIVSDTASMIVAGTTDALRGAGKPVDLNAMIAQAAVEVGLASSADAIISTLADAVPVVGMISKAFFAGMYVWQYGEFFANFVQNPGKNSNIELYASTAGENLYQSGGITVTPQDGSVAPNSDITLHAFWVTPTSVDMSQAAFTGPSDLFTLYNIALYQDSVAIQPDGLVEVMIPIPAGYDASTLCVYRQNSDTGAWEKMTITTQGGYAVFNTEHFSLYAITSQGSAVYTLSINSGSGGGSYRAGTLVTISAAPASANQVFDTWQSLLGGGTFTDPNSSTTTFRMPNNDAFVVAAYKDISNSSLNISKSRVAAGDMHSLAIDAKGSLWAWGYNGDGELGDGTTSDRLAPIKVMNNVASVAAGTHYSLAITTDGSLWAWGINYCGQLGDGTRTTRTSPVKIMSNVTDVTASNGFGMAIQADGSLWSWGCNENGFAVGIGSGLSPVKIMDDVKAIATGQGFRLAVKTDGTLWLWGYDSSGLLGSGKPYSAENPVQVLTGVANVSAGESHVLALKTDGTIWAWGSNDSGQLGDGTNNNHYNPVKVFDGATAMVANTDNSFAIKADGSLWAWGANSNTLLGEVYDQPKPVKVMSNVTQVAFGSSHGLALKTDGTIWSWGDNRYGAIGDGTRTDRDSGIQIMNDSGPIPTQYSVTFDANGGKVSTQSKTIKVGATLGTLPTPTWSGYTFAGWYSQASGGTKYTSTTKLVTTSDVTIYAHWTGKKYTTSFNANGGSTPKTSGKVTKSKSVTMGKTYGSLPTTSRKGYSFSGWFTAKSGGTQITSSSTVASAKNMTLYAHWTAKTYTVKLKPQSGSVSPTSFTVTYAKKYAGLPSPTRAGYSFLGWYTKSSGGSRVYSSTTVKITGTQTLYAHWKAKSYTISFNANGGSTPKLSSKVKKSKSVTTGKTFGTLPSTSRTGYTFAGWYTDPVAGSKITASTKMSLAKSTTLYAHWTAKKYQVKFNAQLGSVPVSSMTVSYGQLYGDLPIPTRDGYQFLGWFTKASGGTQITGDMTAKITATQTLYAQWQPTS